jgi:hypothetical protein
VFGASVLLAEGASQKPQNGIRTRGSQGPDDSLGHGEHMEHPGGAFKANPTRLLVQLKNCSAERRPDRLPTTQTIKIRATILAEFPSLHKKYAVCR